MPLHDVMFVASAKVAKRFLVDVKRLGLNHPGRSYRFEEANGTKLTLTYVGFEGLSLKFFKVDGTTFVTPVIDQDDGTLVTGYLTRIAGVG